MKKEVHYRPATATDMIDNVTFFFVEHKIDVVKGIFIHSCRSHMLMVALKRNLSSVNNCRLIPLTLAHFSRKLTDHMLFTNGNVYGKTEIRIEFC